MLRVAAATFILGFTTVSSSSADLIAHYEFEGNGNDSSGNNFNGYILGSTSTIAGARAGLGNAMEFNNGWMELHSVGVRSLGGPLAPDFSAAFWFRTNTVPNPSHSIGVITNHMPGENRYWGMFLGRSGGSTPGELHASQVDTANSPSSTVLTSGRIDDGMWRHLAYTRNTVDGTASIYIDGTLAGTVADDTLTVQSNEAISIGRYAGFTYSFHMDDLRLYDHALTGAEVSSLASVTAVPEPSSFVILLGFCGIGLRCRRQRDPRE